MTASTKVLAAALDHISCRIRRRIADASLSPSAAYSVAGSRAGAFVDKEVSDTHHICQRRCLHCFLLSEGFDTIVIVPVGSIAQICGGGGGGGGDDSEAASLTVPPFIYAAPAAAVVSFLAVDLDEEQGMATLTATVPEGDHGYREGVAKKSFYKNVRLVLP